MPTIAMLKCGPQARLNLVLALCFLGALSTTLEAAARMFLVPLGANPAVIPWGTDYPLNVMTPGEDITIAVYVDTNPNEQVAAVQVSLLKTFSCSGGGSATYVPGSVEVDDSRSDYIFFGSTTDIAATYEVKATRVLAGVAIPGTVPVLAGLKYIAHFTYHLDHSCACANLAIEQNGIDTFMNDENAAIIAPITYDNLIASFIVGRCCDWSIFGGMECSETDGCSCSGGGGVFSPAQHCSSGCGSCTLGSSCAIADNDPCTCDTCVPEGPFFVCRNTPIAFGNVNCSGPDAQVNLDDVLCVLSGFASFAACPNGDIAPVTGVGACQGNNTINLDDILAVLAAFGGADPCGC